MSSINMCYTPPGSVQQTGSFSERSQKVFTHPDLQATRKSKRCSARTASSNPV